MYNCDYQHNVCCERKTCTTCGWNPEVAQARIDAFLKSCEEKEMKSNEQVNSEA